MLTLLSKFFIKKNGKNDINTLRQVYGVLCSTVGILLNVFLFLGKFFAGTISNSISITADAFNNLSDAGSSIITLVGFRMSSQKPDPGHPFGHGRIEYLSGLFVSIAILLMAVELIQSSFAKILHPENVECNILILAILVISILVKCYMAYYNRSIGRKINSAGMKATATDSMSDMLATTVVLLSTLFTYFTGIIIDGYCGVLVGVFILFTGISAARDTISPLLGQPPEASFVKKIEETVLAHTEILGIHDLIVHDYGPGRVMISLHAEVPASGNIIELHDTIDLIEHELQAKLNCEAVIHMDPILNDDPETIKLSAEVKEVLRQIDGCLHMHDFRVVNGPTHTNIIFDVVVPFKYRLTDAELSAAIQDAVQHLSTTYFTVINIDRDFS
ncbi:MAG: cation diffusion facilitator family transporter [Lachnospiraceae bacterium]|nr:cation diffusion facilitator family transporter [Lachnospiraceae bacterium]